MKVLGIDIGYGDVKVTIGSATNITHQFKFSSAIARAAKASAIRDARIIDVSINDEIHQVYVGEDAMVLPSSQIIDITNYEALEAYAPAFIHKALEIAKVNKDEIGIVVSGLSVTQLDQSGYFKERIQSFTVNGINYKFESVFLLPQGAGSKMAFDKYGENFPDARTESSNSTFVGCDIGFNTLDLYYVTNGKTSPNLFEGLAGEGVMRIAQIVKEKVKEYHNRDITLREAKGVLDTKTYKLRGEVYDFSEVVKNAIDAYTSRLKQIIEEKYGPIIDKCDFIVLQGGGSMFFENTDPFIRVVKNKSEFYNSIGFYLYGVVKSS